MRTEDVLDQIEQALDDWEVGPDAMRCAPEAPAYAAVPPRRPLDRWTFIPALSNPEAPTVAELSAAQDLTPFITDLASWVSHLATLTAFEPLPWQRYVLDQWVGPRSLPWIDEALWDAAVENHGPAPLSIDGHAYARRRRNRRRS